MIMPNSVFKVPDHNLFFAEFDSGKGDGSVDVAAYVSQTHWIWLDTGEPCSECICQRITAFVAQRVYEKARKNREKCES